MTEKKDLKEMVRARMQRTGESYVTAHRHVIAKREEREQGPLAKAPRKLVEIAIKREPRLTHFGLGVYDERRKPEHVVAREFNEDRERLLSDDGLAEVATCAAWLQLQQPIKSMNRRHTSLGYKHMVESWVAAKRGDQYIANGSLIAAALGLGFEWASVGPNVYFNLSERRLKKIQRGIHPRW